MNELSNRVLSELAGVGNFFKSKERNKEDPLDRKLFYLFQQSES